MSIKIVENIEKTVFKFIQFFFVLIDKVGGGDGGVVVMLIFIFSIKFISSEYFFFSFKIKMATEINNH